MHLSDTDITIVRSSEQMLDWPSAGKYVFGIGARGKSRRQLVLSREGQTAWLNGNQKTGGLYDSLREDISKEKINLRARRVKGGKFLWLDPAD